MNIPNKKLHIALAALFFLFIMAITPGLPGFVNDRYYWELWAVYNSKYGLNNAYGSGTDYLPLFQYVLWAFAKIAGSEEDTIRNIGYLRAVILAADYWALWIVYRWIRGRTDYIFLLLCSLCNIAYSYNTIIWAQVDAFFTAFIIASFYYQYKDKFLWSALMIVLAINAKLQAIIFIPLWGLLLIARMHSTQRWKSILVLIPVIIATQFLILAPFAFGKDGISAVWEVIVGSVGKIPQISLNACNIWYWIIPGLKMEFKDDVHIIAGLSYTQVGLFTFCIASLIGMWPALRHTALTLAGRTRIAFPKEKIWLTAAFTALAFYFFNTQMHERYVHPAFIFLTAYAFFCNRFGLYSLFSIAYFLNLERVMCWLRLRNYDTLIFNPRFIASLFAIVMGWIIFLLYRKSTPSSAYLNPSQAQAGFMPNKRLDVDGNNAKSAL